MYAHLISRPISGEYKEVSFNDNNNCVWVHFISDFGEEWVGVFDRGDNDYSTVLETEQFVLVVANGKSYLVDRNSKQLIHNHLMDTCIDSAFKTSTPNLFIICAAYEFIIFQGCEYSIHRAYPESGDLLGSNRRLEFKEQNDSELHGILYITDFREDINYAHPLIIDLHTFEYFIDYSKEIYCFISESSASSKKRRNNFREFKEWL